MDYEHIADQYLQKDEKVLFASRPSQQSQKQFIQGILAGLALLIVVIPTLFYFGGINTWKAIFDILIVILFIITLAAIFLLPVKAYVFTTTRIMQVTKIGKLSIYYNTIKNITVTEATQRTRIGVGYGKIAIDYISKTGRAMHVTLFDIENPRDIEVKLKQYIGQQ